MFLWQYAWGGYFGSTLRGYSASQQLSQVYQWQWELFTFGSSQSKVGPEAGWGYNLQKLALGELPSPASQGLPPQKRHSLPKQHPHLGTESSNTQACRGQVTVDP